MKVNRLKYSVRNIAAGLLNKVIALFVPFVIRTLIIQKLGVEYLGLNSLFASVLQMLSLTELGFGSAMVYSMYKPVAEGDQFKVCALLNFYKTIYRYIGLIIMVFGMALSPFLKYFIASDVPKEINIYVVYYIYLINTAVSYFLFAYKSSLLNACLRTDIDSLITASCNLVMYAFQMIILSCFSNYYYYAILLPITTIIMNVVRSVVVDRLYPEYRPIGNLAIEDIRDIKTKVTGLIGHKIGGMIFSSVDSLVISSFLGLAILGKYTNYYYIFTSLNGFMLILFQSITAVIGNTIVCESVEDNYSNYKQLFFANMCLAGWSSICMLCLYQPFMEIWMGKENMLPLSIPVLLVIYYYITSCRRVCITYKDAAGMWNADFWKPYISVLVNLSLNIISVQVIGLAGVILSSIVALLFVEVPWETHVLFKQYFKKSEKAYYFTFFKMSAVLVLAAGISYYLCGLIQVTTIGILVRVTICSFVTGGVIMAFYWKTWEFNVILTRIFGWRKKI